MPTRKISGPNDRLPRRCRHPEHSPPSMCVFEPGTYEHECPACYAVTYFTVRQATLDTVPRPHVPRIPAHLVRC